MPVILSSTQRTGLETAWYSVSNFGFYSVRVTEMAPAYLHTFSNTAIDATVFFPDLLNAEPGDFNGDGKVDIALTFNFYAHFFPRLDENQARTRLFFNDGNGNLVTNTALFNPAAARGGNNYQNSAVADYNGDGRDDVASSPAGLNPITPGIARKMEPIPLLLSSTGGAFVDATANIQGQENGGVTRDYGAYDMSAGDYDGDGDSDLFSYGSLFLNDGNGRFANATSSLPVLMRGDAQKLMFASAAADFNGDGIDDIAAFGGAPNVPTPTAGGYLLLSNGSADISQRTVIPLPFGPFGAAATTTRDADTGDIDGDGDLDLIVVSSRDSPNFLMGIGLQILLNDGKGGFSDGTIGRIDNTRLGDLSANNGNTATTAVGGSKVKLVDWNGDGHLDIVTTHAKGPAYYDRPLLNIFQNDGTGKFEWIELDMLAWAQSKNLAGSENLGMYMPLRQTFAIDLNGGRMIDFVSVIETPRVNNNTDPQELTAYTILSKSVYGTGPEGVDGASVGAPGFNESYYLSANAGSALAVSQKQFTTGLAHYLAVGKAAGLQSFAPGTHVYGSGGNDIITLREGNEEAFGEDGNDSIDGGAGNDVITGGKGNDLLNGGLGLDTALFEGKRAAYVVNSQNGTLSVSGPDGFDTLSNMERLHFDEGKLAFDLTGNAGHVARLLGAVFGKATVANAQYVGIGLDLLDGGMSPETLMQGALQARLGASASNADVVNLIFVNVAGAPPDAGSLAQFTGMLDSGSISQAGLGLLAANHELNAVSINLVGLNSTGLAFL